MAKIEIIHPHITSLDGVCGGRSVIKGTRIPVWIIVGWLQRGYSPELIKNEIYPHLSLAEIYDALSFYYEKIEILQKTILTMLNLRLKHWNGKSKALHR
jgi:uncharacterized protein (DUF433 family)